MKISLNIAFGALYALASFFWFLIFGIKAVNFWYGMAIAASTLTLLSFMVNGIPLKRADFNYKSIFIAIVATFILYLLFYLGNELAKLLFPFAEKQVTHIYDIKNEANYYAILFILLFITSPCEELFWRGYLQSFTVQKFGIYKGNFLSAFLYGAVHLFSLNLMLFLAAFVAGLFWSFLYSYTRNLFVCILSHCLWTVSIFLLFPIQ